MKSIAPERCQRELQEVGSSDFGFAYADKARFRVSIFKQRGDIAMVLRQIPNEMLPPEFLGVPEIFTKLVMRPRGLILVTGPTGSGKSTTLASLVNYINERVDHHIITIEDPIEFYHYHKKSTDQSARSRRRCSQFCRSHSPCVAAGSGRDSGR